MDIGLTVPQEVEGESEISKGLLSGGLYAIGHFEIGTDEIPAAWSLITRLHPNTNANLVRANHSRSIKASPSINIHKINV